MIPASLLPHTVTLLRPTVSTDSYGNTVYDYATATRIDASAWVQQDARSRPTEDGGNPMQGRWLIITNREDVRRRDRIEWAGPGGLVVFDMDGQPEPAYTPRGFHHTEIVCVVIDG